MEQEQNESPLGTLQVDVCVVVCLESHAKRIFEYCIRKQSEVSNAGDVFVDIWGFSRDDMPM